jgi:phage terminase large subunit GpA-like protein
MPLPFQPTPPPCVKCGTTTVMAPAFEGGQRVFAVRCPACGGAGTYSLDYDTLRDGEPDPTTASLGGHS